MTSTKHTRAEALFFDQALREILAHEAPPDLRARVRAASGHERARAALAVDDAYSGARPRAWLAAAILLLGSALAAGLALRGVSSPSAAEAGQEQPLPDPMALARVLHKAAALTLVARRDDTAARLSDAPEHAVLLTDGRDLLPDLRDALGRGGAAVAPRSAGETDAELLLHGEERAFSRLRLFFDANGVRVGAAAFTMTTPLPNELGAALREHWLRAARAKAPARRRVQVRTVQELLAGIAPNTTLELMEGPFTLPADLESVPTNRHVKALEQWGEVVLEVQEVHNLHIRAVGARARVLGSSSADVLRFSACRDVSLEGIVLGHIEGLEQGCSAPVLTLHDCDGFKLRDCELFGCGTEGIVAERSRNLAMERSEVHTCRYGVVRFQSCTGLHFSASVFRDCSMVWDSGGLSFTDCSNVVFDGCSVRGMSQEMPARVPLFGVQMDEAITFRRGSITGNLCPRVATSKLLLVRQETQERDNGPDVAGPGK